MVPGPGSDALNRRDELVLGGLLLGTLVLSEEAEDDVAGGRVDLPLLKEPVDLHGAIPHGDLHLARELLQRRGERVENSRRSGLPQPDLFRERLEVLDVLAVVILLREVQVHALRHAGVESEKEVQADRIQVAVLDALEELVAELHVALVVERAVRLACLPEVDGIKKPMDVQVGETGATRRPRKGALARCLDLSSGRLGVPGVL
jgi:hypothetical protein